MAAQVTPNPVLNVVPGVPIDLTIENPSATKPLTISAIRLLDSAGSVILGNLLPDSVVIAPGATEDVLVTIPIDIDEPLVDGDQLRLIDARGVPITIVDENGVSVGDITLDVA
jgi:hypothetical protein